MQIGVDASHLDPSHMTGTQNYLYNLLRYLAPIDTDNNYVIYTKYPLSADFIASWFGNASNFSIQEIQSTVSWTQVGLARSLWESTPNVLLCPWQTMPIIHKPNLKIVSVIHDLAYNKGHFAPTAYTALFSDVAIAVSDFTKAELISKFKISESKILVVNEGIDLEKFKKCSVKEHKDVLEKYDIRSEYILFVGSLVPRKNIVRLLKAFDAFCVNSSFSDEVPPPVLVLAGHADKKNRRLIENTIFNMESSDRVKVLNWIPDNDLVPLLSAATFLAYPSESEGFGLPVLEGMACGTPVLTSSTGALPNTSGGAAYLVDPFSVDEIRQGLSNLFFDKDLQTNLVHLGYKNVTQFDWRKTAAQVLQVMSKEVFQ